MLAEWNNNLQVAPTILKVLMTQGVHIGEMPGAPNQSVWNEVALLFESCNFFKNLKQVQLSTRMITGGISTDNCQKSITSSKDHSKDQEDLEEEVQRATIGSALYHQCTITLWNSIIE